MKALLLPLLLLCMALPAQKTYNDLKDFGYSPGVKTVVYNITTGAEYRNNDWVSDSTPKATITFTFSRNGLLQTQEQKTNGPAFKKTYTYAGNKRTGATGSDSKIEWTDTSFVETEYDKRGARFSELTTVFDRNMLTTKEAVKTFDAEGKVDFHMVTEFHSRDKGLLNTWTITDMLTQSKKEYEVTVLQRDSLGNPLKTLKKENGQPVSIHTYQYKFWYPEKPANAGINDDPVWAAEAIIEAAKTGNYSQLHKLCAPGAKNDYDSEFICGMDTLPQRAKNQFVQEFRHAEVDSGPEKSEYGGQLVWLIKHAEGGDYKFVLRFKNVEGKWYLR